jgi:hypothetical protein
MESVVDKIVIQHWEIVCALANVLCKKQRLSGQEAEQIIAEADRRKLRQF